jgi:hypothetical protein
MANTRTTRTTTGTRTARARQQSLAPARITFMGADYRLSEKIGIWPMMQLARAAEAGLSSSEPKGLAALHAYLEQVIDPEDWGQFQDDMLTKKADNLDALMRLLSDAVDAVQKHQEKKGRRPAARAIAGVVEDGDDEDGDD